MPIKAKGQVAIEAQPAVIWAALHDVDCLRRCISGCRSFTRIAEDRYSLTVQVRLGPFPLVFEGEVETFDSEFPRLLNLRGFGLGAAGRAKGTARLRLDPTPTGSSVSYHVAVETNIPFLSMGQPLLRAAVTRLIERFCCRFSAALADADRAALDL